MISVFGWGLVAPNARDVQSFRALLDGGRTALRLSPHAGLGHRLFAVGDPDFSFEDYKTWITARDGERRWAQLETKMGDNARFAIGAVIQALESNAGLEAACREEDGATHVYVGSAVGDLPESFRAHEAFTRALRRWNAFWARPERCTALRRYRERGDREESEPPPIDPATLEVDSEERASALELWNAFWADRSEELSRFERQYAEIEATPVGSDLTSGPLHAIRLRQKLHRKLLEDQGCPPPPWTQVDPKLVWAVQNVPAAEISMLLGTHGAAWSPSGACSTFGVALKAGFDAIARGEAKIAIVGSTEPRPDPVFISAFHRARLAPATGEVNGPFGALLGTHLSGGACIWILGDVDHLARRGLRPIGPSIEAVTVGSDAFHIITPSEEGPKRAISAALERAGANPENLAAWDMHATGTPGDAKEFGLLDCCTSPRVAVSARKGLFGHGMANSGGWELTALALGLNEGVALPTGVHQELIHPVIRQRWGEQIVCEARPLFGELALKVMLGVGGITACVVLRRAPAAPTQRT
jgi:3-oxoacyl-(acyl-carrier-protein) synthase